MGGDRIERNESERTEGCERLGSFTAYRCSFKETSRDCLEDFQVAAGRGRKEKILIFFSLFPEPRLSFFTFTNGQETLSKQTERQERLSQR